MDAILWKTSYEKVEVFTGAPRSGIPFSEGTAKDMEKTCIRWVILIFIYLYKYIDCDIIETDEMQERCSSGKEGDWRNASDYGKKQI